MKNTLFLALLSLAFFAAYCSKSDEQGMTACEGGVAEFSLNEPFYLCYGTEAHWKMDANFTVKFKDVFGDSRCTMDSLALCVWEGRVDVGVLLNIHDFTRLDSLSAPGLSNAAVFDSTEFSGYKIKLLAVEPYPMAVNSPIPDEDYKLKLLVTQ